MGLWQRLFGDGIDKELKAKLDDFFSTQYFPNTQIALNQAISAIKLKGTRLELQLQWPYAAQQLHAPFTEQLQSTLCAFDHIENVVIQHQTLIQPRQTQPNVEPIKGIKNIIAVASGKGGVGKSTTSVNLALALQQEGARVGILDADIYGPSLPTLLGLQGKPTSEDGKTMQPMQAYNLQAMSIGCLIEEDTPMIWRGPIVTQTLNQLLNETRWDQLDFLIIDLPPGTGDVQLTLAQKIPVTGAVIVTTPQDLALIDAKKAIKMFEKVNIPVLGVIENMSTHICSQCGHEEAIFGAHGGEKLAQNYQTDFLGALPLTLQIREQADAGTPTVAAEPKGALADKYRAISHKIGAKLSESKRSYAQVFPKIVVENKP